VARFRRQDFEQTLSACISGEDRLRSNVRLARYDFFERLNRKTVGSSVRRMIASLIAALAAGKYFTSRVSKSCPFRFPARRIEETEALSRVVKKSDADRLRRFLKLRDGRYRNRRFPNNRFR
jgi:hypothetical protein